MTTVFKLNLQSDYQPVAFYFIVAVLLFNYLSYMNSNQSSKWFNAASITLDEYLTASWDNSKFEAAGAGEGKEASSSEGSW